MDMQSVERKVKSGAYATPEDFEYDILLIFQNCIAYNSARKTDHLVAMGKFGMKLFRKVFTFKMKPFDDPSSASAAASSPKEAADSPMTRKNPPEGAAQQGPAKKLKMETTGSSSIGGGGGVSRGKSAPRISLTSSQVSSAAERAAQAPIRSKLPKPISIVPKSKPNQPVPLHIAIAQVKEQFPLRRAGKSLQTWEAGCARFFKEMMRHSWISAARPKFIFHVPVPVLFPVSDRRDARETSTPFPYTVLRLTNRMMLNFSLTIGIAGCLFRKDQKAHGFDNSRMYIACWQPIYITGRFRQ
jgi:hypothetical protein